MREPDDVASAHSETLAQVYRRYFASKPGWRELPDRVMVGLATSLSKAEAGSFEMLVQESAANDLVNKHFLPIAASSLDYDMTINGFAHTLYNYGSKYAEILLNGPPMFKGRRQKVRNHAKALLCLATILEPGFFTAKFAMAMVAVGSKDPVGALALCQQALDDVNRIAVSHDEALSPFEKASKGLGLQEFEKTLRAYMAEIGRTGQHSKS